MNKDERLEQPPIVVVGVDGSAGAGQALRWAITEARLRKTRVRVLHAWTFGFTGVPGGGYGYMGATRGVFTNAGMSELRRAGEELLDRAITEIASDADGVEIERQVVEGGAAEVLVGAVSPRDLLVVGSRGHGGFTELLLGSISHQCAHHAPCPVVIVRAAKPSASRSTSADGAQQENAHLGKELSR